MTTQPRYLSLGVMSGDEHAGAPLERCLRSVLDMKRGCPFDEIVIGFNGGNHELLEATLKKLGYQTTNQCVRVEPSVSTMDWFSSEVYARPPLKVVSFPWPGRFDVARNVYWPYLTGEWRFSMDADDVLADAETPEGLAAIEALERDYGIPPPPPGAPSLTISQNLRLLPAKVTCVMTSYDYEMDENGYVIVRQKMKRLVRRNAGHLWRSPDESGIHEALYIMGAVAEVQVDNLGLLTRHMPSQPASERVKRNAEIVKRLTTTELPVDARHAFDVANARLVQGSLEGADVAIKVAIQNCNNDLDMYTYRLARASLMLAKGNNPEGAMQEAFCALAVLPEYEDAYFMAAHALYLMGRWGGVVEWYERGLAKKPSLLSLDQPLAKFMQPRHETAWAYLQLGKPVQALALAQECINRYPKSSMSMEIFDRAKKAAVLDRLRNDLLDAVDLLSDDAPLFAKNIFSQLDGYAVTRGLSKGGRGRGLKVKLDALGTLTPVKELPADGVFENGGARIELEDALTLAAAAQQQLLEFQALNPKQAKVKARPSKVKRIAFYCPSAIELWRPSHVLTSGLGGSEGSVAYLARELGKRGYVVEVYTPHHVAEGLICLWSGEHEGETFSVIEKDLSLASDVTAGIIIACRAPYLAREFNEHWAGKRIFCWHQDNGYGNPWIWNREVAEAQGHLHVSKWAEHGLVREAYGASVAASDIPCDIPVGLPNHHVLGNGISVECGRDWNADKVVERDIATEMRGSSNAHAKVQLKLEPRNPHRVIYASDPSRGLEALLDAWPAVRQQVTDAQLHIYCSFRVMFALKQDVPGASAQRRIELIQEKMRALGEQGVSYYGWQQHNTVLDAMKAASIYCYPGGPMPEGFGVSLAQAQACGCTVLAPEAGALPEVLDEEYVVLAGGGDNLVSTLVWRLQNPQEDDVRKQVAAEAMERHGWPAVTARFLEITGAL